MSINLEAKKRILYTYNGRVLHHNDCTYCKHRKGIRVRVKGKATFKGIELCVLTGMRLPPPEESHLRYCESYQQKNCNCDDCNVKVGEQMVHFLDREGAK